jgi:hypothetical protein
MAILETLGDAQLLLNEGNRQLASSLADGIGRLARGLGRSFAKTWGYTVSMVTRETSFHLQSGPTPHAKH